jgi:hypothetical protein
LHHRADDADGQYDHRRSEELVAEDMGIRQFGREVREASPAEQVPELSLRLVRRSGRQQRAQTDEKTCLQELLSVGIATESAPTNSFIARRESVAYFLNANASGEPGFLLDPRCTTLRRGFNGGYRYERMR